MMVHTRRPEMSEYFLAGLKDGGASMVLSKMKEHRKVHDTYYHHPVSTGK
jgi:hypothetical protein